MSKEVTDGSFSSSFIKVAVTFAFSSIYGVEKSRQISKELMEEALGILDYLGENEFLKELFISLIDREK